MSEPGGYKKLRPSGGYRTLRSFRTSTLIYDATVSFCDRFIDKHSRLVDQMVQAARSGRQNIAEGSRASATSSQTELRLVNVARASLDELLLDYEDYLRQHGQRQWAKDAPEAIAVRGVGAQLHHDPTDQPDLTDQTDHEAYATWLHNPDPAIVANTLICLIHQTNYLLDQLIREGGYSEQLAAARLQERKGGNHQSDRPDPTDPKAFPNCPLCGKLMVLRTAKQGKNAGAQFLGCSGYPECKGTKHV